MVTRRANQLLDVLNDVTASLTGSVGGVETVLTKEIPALLTLDHSRFLLTHHLIISEPFSELAISDRVHANFFAQQNDEATELPNHQNERMLNRLPERNAQVALNAMKYTS